MQICYIFVQNNAHFFVACKVILIIHIIKNLKHVLNNIFHYYIRPRSFIFNLSLSFCCFSLFFCHIRRKMSFTPPPDDYCFKSFGHKVRDYIKLIKGRRINLIQVRFVEYFNSSFLQQAHTGSDCPADVNCSADTLC